MKLEEVEKLQNDIEVLMKKYVDNEGNIKHWKVQSIAGSIVKNLIIQRVSNRRELLFAFEEYWNVNNCDGENFGEVVDRFLANNSC